MKKLVLFFFISITISSLAQNQNSILIPYRRGNLTGLCDTMGNIKLEPKFDSIGDYSGQPKFLRVFMNSKIGILDVKKMNVTIPILYDQIGFGSKEIFQVKIKSKWGVLKKNGEEIVTPTYDSLTDFSSNTNISNLYFLVANNNKWGLLNSRGNVILPLKYDNIINASDYEGYLESNANQYIINKDTQYFRFDAESGNIYNIIYEQPSIMSMYIAEMSENSKKKYLEYYQKAYYLDSIYLDSNFIENEPTGDGIPRFYKIRKGNKIGILDISNQKEPIILFNKKYDIIAGVLDRDRSRNLNIFIYRKGKLAVINKQEKIIFPFKKIKLLKSYSTYFLFEKKGKVGAHLLNSAYHEILAKYDAINLWTIFYVNPYWSFMVFRVLKNGNWGYVGENGIEYFE